MMKAASDQGSTVTLRAAGSRRRGHQAIPTGIAAARHALLDLERRGDDEAPPRCA